MGMNTMKIINSEEITMKAYIAKHRLSERIVGDRVFHHYMAKIDKKQYEEFKKLNYPAYRCYDDTYWIRVIPVYDKRIRSHCHRIRTCGCVPCVEQTFLLKDDLYITFEVRHYAYRDHTMSLLFFNTDHFIPHDRSRLSYAERKIDILKER